MFVMNSMQQLTIPMFDSVNVPPVNSLSPSCPFDPFS